MDSRRVSDADVLIENGVVVARATLPSARVVDGHGAYLMPALWDLKASLWGNDSTYDWEVLTQDINFTQCAALQLYYGVAHVGVFGMKREWVERELKRADALELSAAEPLYPGRTICGKKSHGCDPTEDVAAAKQALAERVHYLAPLFYIAYSRDPKSWIPGVKEEVLAELLAGAAQRQLPAIVLVDDWADAERAVQLGARVVYGFPAHPVPDGLLQLMRERGVAFAPALARHLELDRLLGNDAALADPFMNVSLQADVRESYRSEKGLWHEWRTSLVLGRERRSVMLQNVERVVKAGVQLVSVSDAGSVPGAFQGYASHATQAWFEKAGLSGWDRLAAATTWPAAVLGRHIGFAPGDAADFLAVEVDPVASAANLRKISLVVRKGSLVNRDKLLPDLTRGLYKP
ncbi:MAG TPA: amidohydrolase family protein [Polyangiaceae bacterium]|nr:amidohydrolase family protein [Polyangiaceae bacterium]